MPPLDEKNITPDDFDFDVVETIVESSHFDRMVKKCKRCGQLYLYEWYEWIDWMHGNDEAYVTYIPIDEKDIDSLRDMSPMALLLVEPRLQYDKYRTIGWVGR